jgi:hypothetical protein
MEPELYFAALHSDLGLPQITCPCLAVLENISLMTAETQKLLYPS